MKIAAVAPRIGYVIVKPVGYEVLQMRREGPFCPLGNRNTVRPYVNSPARGPFVTPSENLASRSWPGRVFARNAAFLRDAVPAGEDQASAGRGARFLRNPAWRALFLMALRSMTIAAKFALTLFIARYLGLAELGVYGIIASASAIVPVVFGFGVAINLGREAAKNSPASIALRLLQYFLFLIPLYAALCVIGMFIWPEHVSWLGLLAVLLFLDHLQTEMFTLMTLSGSAYAANISYFIRFAGWCLLYIPFAFFYPQLRNLTSILVFWLVGCAVATFLTVVMTRRWRWGAALRTLARSRLQLPHRHGSVALYFGDIANVSFVYLDRYIVGLFLSAEALGIYVLYWSITNALNNLITISVVQIKSGELVRIVHSGGKSFKRSLVATSISSCAIAVALGAMATLMMYFVVPHLGRPEVVAYLPLMFVLCAGLVLRTLYEVAGNAFYAHGRDDLILSTVVGVLVVALGLNLWLDPRIGIWGAGFALVASYALGVIARTVVIQRGFRHRPAPADLAAPG